MGREAPSLTEEPLAPRRRLGFALRILRESAGLYLDDAAKHLECSTSKISRLESGLTIPRVRDVRDLLALYRVQDQDFRVKLLQWAEAGRIEGWWLDRGKTWPGRLERFLSLEASATAINDYCSWILPGLLQTTDYARATLQNFLPHYNHEEIEDLVTIRLKRQEVQLQRKNPVRLTVVLDEAVLYRVVGSQEIMRAQLEQLLTISMTPSHEIHVRTLSSGVTFGIESSFTLIYPEPHAGNCIVFLELPGGTKFIKADSEVKEYVRCFENLLGSSLNQVESRSFIAEAIKKYA